MSDETSFQFELFEEYYGDAKEVQKKIDDCQICGSKYIFSHLSDYRLLMIHETAKCPSCGASKKKKLHIIN